MGQGMDFEFSDDQRAVRDAAERICQDFPDSYWLARDEDGVFPHEFHAAMAEGGWLGIAMPVENGGAGLGITEAALMMQTVAASGGAMAAASSIHMNIFAPHPIVVHGTDEQKKRMLEPLIRGEQKACFGVTEPDAGLDTTRITTRAVKDGKTYLVNGRKIWISTAQIADHIMLLCRTTALEDCARPTEGLSLFYTPLDRDHIEVREIPKMGRKAVDSNTLFIDGLTIPEEDLIGGEGQGFSVLLQGLNPERILIAAEALGIGRDALARAARYASEREVFGRPIGQNQAIQHPLAQSWIDLEAAELLTFRAAALFDGGNPVGAQANAAKYFAAEAAFSACERAVMTLGGMGYAKEFHVERLLREVMIARIAPVSRELILSHIGEKILGLPKSY
jgi:acyl-CoA dehydrogenase